MASISVDNDVSNRNLKRPKLECTEVEELHSSLSKAQLQGNMDLYRHISHFLPDARCVSTVQLLCKAFKEFQKDLLLEWKLDWAYGILEERYVSAEKLKYLRNGSIKYVCLEHLFLRNDKKALAETLKVNFSLIELRIGSNKIRDEGANAIGKAL